MLQTKVREFLQRLIDGKRIPGAVIRISYQGDVIMDEAIGYRLLDPKPEPMARETVFDLASVTKVVSTLPAMLKLIETGDIRLDDPVTRFIPDFAQNKKEDVRIRHLLTHTSGLRDHVPFYNTCDSTEEVLDHIYQETLVAPVGQQVIYSDLGFILLYHIIEIVTKQAYQDFMEENFFKPLEMTETGFQPTFPDNRYAATEYSDDLGDYKRGIVHDENTEIMGGISGHAGLFSTVDDLHRFAMMIEHDGTYNDKQILSPAVLDLARKNYTPFSEYYRGLGWALKSPAYASCGDLFSDASFGHTGFTGTSIWFDPEIQLHVILLTNRVYFGRQWDMASVRPRLHNLIRAHLSAHQ